MVSDSAPSSRASIISLDPAIASQITGTGTTQASSQPTRSRTGSSAAYRARTPETVDSRGHGRTKSTPDKSMKKRSNSLRHAKNSTEVLRQRSNKSAKKPSQLETIVDTREGRNFTIGNVGTGGKLYLRPSANQVVAVPVSSPTAMPLTAPANLPILPFHDDTIFPAGKHPGQSDSPSTAIRSTSPKRSLTKSSRRPTTGIGRPRHGRSQSFSTLEDRPSVSGSMSRTLRIVINRPGTGAQNTLDGTDQTPPQMTLPTLEVPIPHYRIGTPRFSTQGTPILRNSSQSRTSGSQSDASHSAGTIVHSQILSSGPPPSSIKALGRLESSQKQQFVGSTFNTAAQARLTTSSGSSHSNSTIREAVHPEIYDELAEVYDDPAVVRYSQNVREITAATPARIIAQISSESFMDYELVSDFFLTFRSYMSTFTVLDLLLARLRWAIDRQEDDGRIIRVRTFAALRHWILNYFMDDFMPDPKLRVRFCNAINKMYLDVKNRPSIGTSDLKVLRDLKRCWNGRCSLYWDPADFTLDGDQDDDLRPGGFGEEQESHIVEESVQIQAQPVPPGSRNKPTSGASLHEHPPVVSPRVQQDRQLSVGKQESLQSDGSVQASSCSIPKGILRSTEDGQSQSKGRHPVSVQLRRKNAPSNLHVATKSTSTGKPSSHRRGAASIDSDREPTPRNFSPTSFHIPVQNGSLIRGFVYAPSAPFVQIISGPATPSIPRFDVHNLHTGDIRRGDSPNSAHGPGVKTIFGSLRKALAGRHGHSDMALVTVSAPMPLQGPTRQRSNMPLNVSRSHDELRSRRPPVQNKGQIRIDLLCAAVAQNYEAVFPMSQRPKKREVSPHAATGPHANTTNTSNFDSTMLSPELKRERQTSHTTAQSGSILIADGTALEVPAMSGALHSYTSLQNAWQGQAGQVERQVGLGIGHQTEQGFAPLETQRSSDALGEVQTLSHDHFVQEARHEGMDDLRQVPRVQQRASSQKKKPASTTGSSSTLRNRRSYQSSSEAGQPKPSIDATATTLSSPQENDEEAAVRLPAQALRRRPGGDLRNVEMVRELNQAIHHDSLETTTTQSRSPAESLLVMSKGPRPKQGENPENRKQVSMINTHSSQHLRPSFEAAVAGFSAIPDDDDGGLEATLMKLEGKYERTSPPLEQYPVDTTDRRRSMPNLSLHTPLGGISPVGDDKTTKRGFVDARDDGTKGSATKIQDENNPSQKSSIFGLPTVSVAGSESSYDSLPLLKRDTATGTVQHVDMTKIIPSPLHLQRGFKDPKLTQNLGEPQELAGTDPRSLARPGTANESAQSFLLDEDENLSDLSSEISVDIINYTGVMDQSMSPMLAAPGTAISGLEIPSHPLTYASVVNLAPFPDFNTESSVHLRNSQATEDALRRTFPGDAPPVQVSQTTARISAGPAHIPFVLACDSQILAQQLTIIEKSALGEVEWSDLVEMRWDNKSANVLDWAEYLIKGGIRGIDLVITRFNLVVKWTLSEIVLTQDIAERAQVIMKFIHVAAHARRLHNYATMLQLTIALTSTDCTKLTKTWDLVPDPDKSLLKNMEALVQPVRNFHDLRAEMESADMSDGCIPFIGLYVHDLTYNAQKPAEIVGRRGTGPLINFERHRTTAVIVKGLLRLIDASSRYTFEPVEGVIERCLWLAALQDERIRNMSRSLEK